VVRQVREYAQREGVKLTLRVRKENPGGANLPNH
jgi:hypothetical protein